MIIVFDTNIWLANLYLRTPAAAAARFFISQNKASVALPEVVRLEVQHHLREHLQRAFSKFAIYTNDCSASSVNSKSWFYRVKRTWIAKWPKHSMHWGWR